MVDVDAFEERAAIAQYDGGLSRFQAETLAAEMQGVTRWQAMQEVRNAKRSGDFAAGGDLRSAMGGRQRSDDVPGVQPRAAEENRPMPERDAQAGRDGLALLALRAQRGGVV